MRKPNTIHMNTKDTSQRFADWIERSGKSKAEIARSLVVHPSFISEWLKGDREISTKHLRSLCILGCDINWLLTGKKHK